MNPLRNNILNRTISAYNDVDEIQLDVTAMKRQKVQEKIEKVDYGDGLDWYMIRGQSCEKRNGQYFYYDEQGNEQEMIIKEESEYSLQFKVTLQSLYTCEGYLDEKAILEKTNNKVDLVDFFGRLKIDMKEKLFKQNEKSIIEIRRMEGPKVGVEKVVYQEIKIQMVYKPCEQQYQKEFVVLCEKIEEELHDQILRSNDKWFKEVEQVKQISLKLKNTLDEQQNIIQQNKMMEELQKLIQKKGLLKKKRQEKRNKLIEEQNQVKIEEENLNEQYLEQIEQNKQLQQALQQKDIEIDNLLKNVQQVQQHFEQLKKENSQIQNLLLQCQNENEIQKNKNSELTKLNENLQQALQERNIDQERNIEQVTNEQQQQQQQQQQKQQMEYKIEEEEEQEDQPQSIYLQDFTEYEDDKNRRKSYIFEDDTKFIIKFSNIDLKKFTITLFVNESPNFTFIFPNFQIQEWDKIVCDEPNLQLNSDTLLEWYVCKRKNQLTFIIGGQQNYVLSISETQIQNYFYEIKNIE